jgi:hypothetical protein
MSPSSSIALPWRSVPLATLIDPHFSTISPSVFKLDSVSMVCHHHQTWTKAFILYSQLSQVPHAISRGDLRAAKSWATSAERLNHNSAPIAYQTTLKFLEQHVALLASSPHHFDIVREVSSLAMDAFSCSVRCGDLAAAVELVEQGRAVFWTQMVRFRTLSASGGEALAKEFMQLSFSLRHAFNVSTEKQSKNTQKLTMQLDDAISRIRMLPGLSRFLLPQLFSNLQKAAKDGPVIIVNASQYSYDALIIMSTQDPVHIPLNVTQAEFSELSSEFQSITEHVGSSDHELESNKIISVKCSTQAFGSCRRSCGSGSHRQEIDSSSLTHLVVSNRCFPNLSHFCISSYIPTLAELVCARHQVSRDVAVQHFVANGQANSDGAKVLRCVDAELSVVTERYVSSSPHKMNNTWLFKFSSPTSGLHLCASHDPPSACKGSCTTYTTAPSSRTTFI